MQLNSSEIKELPKCRCDKYLAFKGYHYNGCKYAIETNKTIINSASLGGYKTTNMNTIIKDIKTFILKFWTIIWSWIVVTIEKYKFKNTVMLAIALFLWFGMAGKFWAFWGWATLFTWIGMNVESILTVYRELKEKNDW